MRGIIADVAEPFRDEMSAAVARIERLATENEQLKDELVHLRGAATKVKEHSTDEHAHVLADHTLKLLEQLDASIDQRDPQTDVVIPTHEHSLEIAPVATLTAPATAPIVSNVAVLVGPRVDPRAHVLRIAVSAFIAGVAVGALLHFVRC